MKILMVAPFNRNSGVSTHARNLKSALEKHISDLKIDTFTLKFTSLKNRVLHNFLKIVFKISNIYEVVHLHPSGYFGGLFTMLWISIVCKIRRVNFIITYHYPSYNIRKKLKNPFFKILFYYIFKNVSSFICVSNAQKREIENVYGDLFSYKIHVIYNGVDLKEFKIINKTYARELLNLPTDKKIIFSLGMLEKYKGHIYLIQAIRRIVEKNKNILCFIGGKGKLEKYLKDSITKYDLDSFVKILGFVPNDELSLWYNSADLFVLPSLSESFGIVQIEAMAVGTPVVATINGGSEEIIISEDYGFLCPPADPECLAEKILIAFEKDWNRNKIREYAKNFSWKNIAIDVFHVYRNAMGDENGFKISNKKGS
ncbi:glycosyltransferase [Aciduliprofundum sp. MAR08-339]|uniref:glycosyltransferase family 4 protein n=1 Tax=Aciduliprofundum sp. (strain MAR08-339) TaxID=673860 RepID=UPI0002A4C7CB|nr:glycosyltransferase [Aciduliprofundum sp. MAR08-339]